MRHIWRVLRIMAGGLSWPRLAFFVAFVTVLAGMKSISDWPSLWRLVVLALALVCIGFLALVLHAAYRRFTEHDRSARAKPDAHET